MIPTRTTDQAFSALFSFSRPFSEHLTKREDDQLRDKYDHNSFFYEGQPSVEEVRQALAYQKARRDAFLKLEGYAPLERSFGLEGEETLTMVLPEQADPGAWKINPAVSIGAPDFEQLERNELRYYGPLYGEDFTLRNNRRLREKLTYHGAYLDGELAGSCYTWSAGGYTCLDSLLVDSAFRQVCGVDPAQGHGGTGKARGDGPVPPRRPGGHPQGYVRQDGVPGGGPGL